MIEDVSPTTNSSAPKSPAHPVVEEQPMDHSPTPFKKRYRNRTSSLPLAWVVVMAAATCWCSPATAQYGISPNPMSSQRRSGNHTSSASTSRRATTAFTGGRRDNGLGYGQGVTVSGLRRSSAQQTRSALPATAPRARGVGRFPRRLPSGRPTLDATIAGAFQRLTATSSVPNLRFATRQQDVDRTLGRIEAEDDLPRRSFSDLMDIRFNAFKRERLENGWTYFKQGEYRRALSEFVSAESIDRRDPIPRFGQLISTAAAGQFLRAINKLDKIVTYNAKKPDDVDGMFAYPISLRSLFDGDDAFERFADTMRRFSDQNHDNPNAQALYCYLLWYYRDEDATIQAQSIAARIKDANPEAPWARFEETMRNAPSQTQDTTPGSTGLQPATTREAASTG